MIRHEDPHKPEFSRVVRVDEVSVHEKTETIEASPAERQALAERFDLQDIGRFTATIHLRRVRGGTMIRVAGQLEADVVQTCVATLEPVPAHVSEPFDALFAPPELIGENDDDFVFDPGAVEEDQPEAFEDGRIDIGELAAQHLSLALDPYPRAPGAVFEPVEEHPAPADDEPDIERSAPDAFAALAKMKRPG